MSSQLDKDPLGDALATALIEAMAGLGPGIEEGRVRGRTARYRRLDCDGRALAYLRVRRRPPVGLRVDLSALWLRPGPSALEIPGRTGSVSLLLTEPLDVAEAARYLAWAVAHMRALLARERSRAPSLRRSP